MKENKKTDKKTPVSKIPAGESSKSRDIQIEELEKQVSLLRLQLSLKNEKNLLLQNDQKIKRAAELRVANVELVFQNGEKEKRAAELVIANIELVFQNGEKEKRAAELDIANIELVFQNGEKEKRAAELNVANIELVYQNGEKENRAAELGIANIELIYQNSEKEKRAAELGIANIELVFQNGEKEKRAAELGIANIELKFQNREKEKRAAELGIANVELRYQNGEKEKRAAELVIANIELVYQNGEKEKRAAELVIANVELVFQNVEKEKRAAELIIANHELQSFAYISSHDLQEPLRKIQIFSNIILQTEFDNLSEKGKDHFNRIYKSANRMQTLIQDLLCYSHAEKKDRKFETTSVDEIIKDVCDELADNIKEKNAVITAENIGNAYINKLQFRQVIINLISNALKFSRSDLPAEITIRYKTATGEFLQEENKGLQAGKLVHGKNYCHIHLRDNGIGYDRIYKDQIFDVFQRLHSKDEYAGTGIGLAIVKKIIDNHSGAITSDSVPGEGASFDIYIPENEMAA